jgi:GrpB-like predicted nucleotidyltransferase (UPF0157 family)
MALIEIVDYQPRWPDEFAEIAAKLRTAFGPLALAIHHIGSTSVPDLAAKDVIDLQVSVAALDPGDPIEAAVAAAGYAWSPDPLNDHVPIGADPNPALWRKRYAGAGSALLPALPGARRTHIHIRQLGLPNHRYALLFRDYLRASLPARENYALLKRELARLHPDDVDAYYAVKDPVCDLILDAAEHWAGADRLAAAQNGCMSQIAASGMDGGRAPSIEAPG